MIHFMAKIVYPKRKLNSPLSDSDWGESSLTLAFSHCAFVYDACPSVFSHNISASSQEVMGPGDRRQLAAAGSPGRKILKMASHSS